MDRRIVGLLELHKFIRSMWDECTCTASILLHRVPISRISHIQNCNLLVSTYISSLSLTYFFLLFGGKFGCCMKDVRSHEGTRAASELQKLREIHVSTDGRPSGYRRLPTYSRPLTVLIDFLTIRRPFASGAIKRQFFACTGRTSSDRI